MMDKDDLSLYVHQVAQACREMRPYEIEYRVTMLAAKPLDAGTGSPAEPDNHGIAQYVDGIVLILRRQRRLRDELEARERLFRHWRPTSKVQFSAYAAARIQRSNT